MFEPALTRQELPHVQVFIDVNGVFEEASGALADDVRGDLADTRDKIINRFKATAIPGVQTVVEGLIGLHFSEQSSSIPETVLVDSHSDKAELLEIFRSQQFRNMANEEFFCNSASQVHTVGGDVVHDLVMMQDSRDAYRTKAYELLEGWGMSAKEEHMELYVTKLVAQLVVHELTHLAGEMAASAVAVRPIDDGFEIVEGAAGFTPMSLSKSAELKEESGYYCGAVIEEGWAAYQASTFMLDILGYKRYELDLTQRYKLLAEAEHPKFGAGYFPVIGFSSGKAGMIIEKLNEKETWLLPALRSVRGGEMTSDEIVQTLRDTVPPQIFDHLYAPGYDAWLELEKLVDL